MCRTPICNWSILATRDDSEAFAAVASFSKALVLVTVGDNFRHLCGVDADRAVRWCGRSGGWRRAPRRSAAGDYEVAIPVKSRDEIGDLTAAFNEMSRNLQIKEELLNEQRRENDRLLRSMMPEPVVRALSPW